MLFSDRYELIALYHAFQRLHSQNVDNGLNDLTDSFSSFMTRARYFAIGHIKRTLSYSAVDMMHLRRDMLPTAGISHEATKNAQLSMSLLDVLIAEFFSGFGLILSLNQCELNGRIHYCVRFTNVDSAARALSQAHNNMFKYINGYTSIVDVYNKDNRISNFRSVTSIDALSDELLLKVLLHVDLRTFIRSERVCRKWQKVMKKSWKDLKELNLPRWLQGDHTALYNSVLRSVLSRVSSNLQSLDLSVKNHFFDEESLKIITRYCPTLERISLRGFNVRAKALRLCHTLTHLVFTESSYLQNKALWWLLRHCRHLRCLDLSRCSRISGINFYVPCNHLEELHLDGCVVNPALLEEFCATKPFMKVLHVDDCCMLNDEFFALHLRVVSARGRGFKFLTSVGLRQIGKLKQLEELHLDFSRVIDDECLAAITCGCPDLKIFTCGYAGLNSRLTAKGLSLLGLCTKLREVDLSDVECCDDDVIIAIASNGCLQTVRLRNSSRISDNAINCLANHCAHLKEVDVSGCVRVTDKSIRLFAQRHHGIACMEAASHGHEHVEMLGTKIVSEFGFWNT
ncbi:unnamed protein product [Soboliphyme baturini]|uniref:F-box domain-containing protein n=1 Tax=Soboliphyme baturini TaxID=241478 RepID=A0A183IJ61_9BILA|nr:unnamed protein product [Soboliphyme baturini]